jgi:hypothetical protein
LPRTRADRERTKDPRMSIEERYESRERYLALVSAAAQDLVKQRYMLEDDVDDVVKRAGEHWNLLFANGEASTIQK